jgi:hypothetical protein
MEAPASPDERESPERVEDAPARAQPRPDTGEAQEGAWRRWRRRWFGG